MKMNNNTKEIDNLHKISNERKIEHGLLTYISGGYYDFGGNEELIEIFNDFADEWELAPCDDDGATPEQDDNLDAIIDKYIEILIKKGY